MLLYCDTKTCTAPANQTTVRRKRKHVDKWRQFCRSRRPHFRRDKNSLNYLLRCDYTLRSNQRELNFPQFRYAHWNLMRLNHALHSTWIRKNAKKWNKNELMRSHIVRHWTVFLPLLIHLATYATIAGVQKW